MRGKSHDAVALRDDLAVKERDNLKEAADVGGRQIRRPLAPGDANIAAPNGVASSLRKQGLARVARLPMKFLEEAETEAKEAVSGRAVGRKARRSLFAL